MTPHDFLTGIVRPTLAVLNLGGIPAEQLLLGTVAQESGFRNIQQDSGPALGFFQMQPSDHDDLWRDWLAYRFHFATKVRGFLPAGTSPTPADLILFPAYGCAMARLHYERAPGAIPADLDGQAAYYKAVWNTPDGAATVQEYLDNWDLMIKPAAAELWPLAA